MTLRPGPVGVAIVGCGTISHEYLRNLTSFPDVRLVACADLDLDRAAAVAREHGVPVADTAEAVLARPDVDLVVNLTIPAVHAEVSLAAVQAGKHVYSEKPLALDPAGAEKVLAEAARAGVRVGGAPDTFLGPGWQAVYRLVADGAIGTPLSAIALLQSPGPEGWHPSPEFLFQPGAGPLFDMGPYYLTALAALFGPVARVSGVARAGKSERVIGSGPRAGTRFPVETPTHVSAQLEFAGGSVATLVFSFDSPLRRADFVEITGSDATLSAPNPNGFGGTTRIHRADATEWSTVADTTPGPTRGLGVVDLIRAIRADTPHRASGDLARHVVDVMSAVLDSADRGEFVTVTSTFSVTSTLPPDWDPTVPG